MRLRRQSRSFAGSGRWQSIRVMTHQVMKRNSPHSRVLQARTYGWLLLVAALAATGCSTQPDVARLSARPLSVVPQSAPTAPGHLTIASWYGPGFNGQRRNLPRKQTDCSLAYPPDGIANTRDEPQPRAIGRGPDQRSRPVRSRPRNRSFRGRAREIGLMRKGVARVRLTSLDAPPPTIRSEPSS